MGGYGKLTDVGTSRVGGRTRGDLSQATLPRGRTIGPPPIGPIGASGFVRINPASTADDDAAAPRLTDVTVQVEVVELPALPAFTGVRSHRDIATAVGEHPVLMGSHYPCRWVGRRRGHQKPRPRHGDERAARQPRPRGVHRWIPFGPQVAQAPCLISHFAPLGDLGQERRCAHRLRRTPAEPGEAELPDLNGPGPNGRCGSDATAVDRQELGHRQPAVQRVGVPSSRVRIRSSAGHASATTSRGTRRAAYRIQRYDDDIVKRSNDRQELGYEVDG